eukprot:4835475-Amphidinium_carterae.1
MKRRRDISLNLKRCVWMAPFWDVLSGLQLDKASDVDEQTPEFESVSRIDKETRSGEDHAQRKSLKSGLQ